MNFVNSILALIVRRIFQQHLGAEVLGINSVFSNILAFLSLSELGLGTVIEVCLYKPLADKDYKKISAYMALLKKVYICIGIGIFVVGLALMPLVPSILTVNKDNLFIYVSFFLYLLNVASSYFFSYKRILLSADQRAYISQIISILFKLVINVGYILALIFSENYQIYLIVGILGSFLENIVISVLCHKEYPYIGQDVHPVGKQEKKEIVTKLKGMLCLRIGNYLINGADNIIISKFISTVIVAYYANYYLIINTLDSICSGFSASVCSSLGNLIFTDRDKLDITIEKILLVQYFLFGITAPAFFVLSTDFVKLFFGQESVMTTKVVFMMSVVYFLNGYSNGVDTVRKTFGLYEKDRIVNLLVPLINIIISVLLVAQHGVIGVLVGTVFSYILQKLIVLPAYVAHEVSEFKLSRYYFIFSKHFMLSVLNGTVAYWISRFIIVDNFMTWCIKAFICVGLMLIFNIAVFYKKPLFREILSNLRMAFGRKRNE